MSDYKKLEDGLLEMRINKFLITENVSNYMLSLHDMVLLMTGVMDKSDDTNKEEL